MCTALQQLMKSGFVVVDDFFFSCLTKGNLIKASGGRGLAGDTRVFWVPVGCPTPGGDPMG